MIQFFLDFALALEELVHGVIGHFFGEFGVDLFKLLEQLNGLSNSLFDAAIFSSVNLTISSQVLIDSFDSTLGTYASQVNGGYAGDGAVVQSNGDVTVERSTKLSVPDIDYFVV